MPVLNQIQAGDTYQTSSAVLQDVFNARGGWFSVSVNSAFVQLEYGVLGATYWTDEMEVGVGAFATLPGNCIGVQFRNAATGKPATITAQLAQGGEPSERGRSARIAPRSRSRTASPSTSTGSTAR